MCSQSFLKTHAGFELRFLSCVVLAVGISVLAICLILMVVGKDTLLMLLSDFIGYAFHAKNLDIKSNSVWEGIVDCGEGFFVNLTHVYAEACYALAVVSRARRS